MAESNKRGIGAHWEKGDRQHATNGRRDRYKVKGDRAGLEEGDRLLWVAILSWHCIRELGRFIVWETGVTR